MKRNNSYYVYQYIFDSTHIGMHRTSQNGNLKLDRHLAKLRMNIRCEMSECSLGHIQKEYERISTLVM